MRLVMLETNGNQQYVFSSPRQRENIGASYLLTQLATWTTEELDALGLIKKAATDSTGGLPEGTFQWVSRSSGKVILTVPDGKTARLVISAVTRRAHAQAPGIDVSGVWCATTGDHVTAADLRRIHTVAARYGVSRPATATRFSQAPFLRPADDSALPACPAVPDLYEPGPDADRSLPSRVKRNAGEKARDRLISQAEDEMGVTDSSTLARHLKALKDGFDQMIAALDANPEAESGEDTNRPPPARPALSRVAVIHIDGNGVGAIMQDLDASLASIREAIPAAELRSILGDEAILADLMGTPPSATTSHATTSHATAAAASDAAHPDDLRLFLLQVNARLDAAVRTAFFTAWQRVAEWSATDRPGDQFVIPVVPILLGGDDATVLTEGRYALPFMDAYLTAYEHATATDPLLRYLGPPARRAPGAGHGPMTAAAGAAIVRRPFPFHIAYDLAERLVTHAKTIGKKPGQECSTLTYHQLFDSTVTDAAELLRSYRLVTGRPYRLNTRGTEVPRPDEPPASTSRTDDGAPDAPRTPPELRSLSGQAWPDMLERVRRYGPPAAEDEAGPDDSRTRTMPLDVPKTRAARIRKALSDSHRAATPAKPMRISDTVTGEWEALVRAVDLDTTDELDDALGSPRLLLDLIELSELLPPSYLRDMAAASQARTATTADDAAKGTDHD